MSNKQFKSKKQTADRYNKAGRTLDRWVNDEQLGFPQPMIINGRWFFALDELEAWELARASQSRKAA